MAMRPRSAAPRGSPSPGRRRWPSPCPSLPGGAGFSPPPGGANLRALGRLRPAPPRGRGPPCGRPRLPSELGDAPRAPPGAQGSRSRGRGRVGAHAQPIELGGLRRVAAPVLPAEEDRLRREPLGVAVGEPQVASPEVSRPGVLFAVLRIAGVLAVAAVVDGRRPALLRPRAVDPVRTTAGVAQLAIDAADLGVSDPGGAVQLLALDA